MPVLDTTFLISGDRRPTRIEGFLIQLLEAGEPLLVPVQAAIEFAAGKADPAAAYRQVRDAFTLVPCGPEIGLEAARLAREGAARGDFPGWADIQIAATASHEGMAIVTNNPKHFEPFGIAVLTHP